MNTTLPQSVCILGRQPALGLAELESLYGSSLVSLLTPQVAGLGLPISDVQFTRLGGSTRLARIVAEVPSKLWKDVEKQLLKSVVELAMLLPEGKVQLGLSAYNIPITSQKLNATGLTLKKVLRSKTGKSVRVTPNPELELNTAQVLHNHLTGQTGMELLIIATEDNRTLIARTTDVQDIDSYALRDRGRPKRDARVGMLPPKLAQIIINLACNATDTAAHTVLDPFCGTGVLLQEAILMGYGSYGTDLEQRMIEYSQANLDWLKTEFALEELHSELAQGDATNFTWQHQFDFIAGETYLGRPFTDRPSDEMIAQTSTEVNLILKKFLRNMYAQIPSGSRICLAVPAWATGFGQFKHLPFIDQLEDLGYNRTRFEHASNEELLYYREDQFTARELLVLTRK
jgi:tRNA G10  N-methylase Trm11